MVGVLRIPHQDLSEFLDEVRMPCHVHEVQELVLGSVKLAKELDHLGRLDDDHHDQEVLQAEQAPGMLVLLYQVFVNLFRVHLFDRRLLSFCRSVLLLWSGNFFDIFKILLQHLLKAGRNFVKLFSTLPQRVNEMLE